MTYDEFTYFIPLITDKESLNEIIENIRRYRKNELMKEDVIYKKLISMGNYQEAEKVLLANKVTEELICSVGMNRKSKTYDKIFFQLYQLLKAIFIDKSNQDYLKTFEIIGKITGKSSIHWKNLIFKTNKKESVKKDKEKSIAGMPWGIYSRLMIDPDYRIKMPNFSDYDELEDILKTAFKIYEDFKQVFLEIAEQK